MYKTARNLTVLGVGLGISAVVGWLLLRESKRDRDKSSVVVKSQYSTEPEIMPQIVLPLDDLEENDTAAPDDLTELKDIGPRFAEALNRIGITRFAQLAEQTPEALAEQLSAYVTVRMQRIRDNNWIGQAAERARSQRS